jgi:hypothetical protein
MGNSDSVSTGVEGVIEGLHGESKAHKSRIDFVDAELTSAIKRLDADSREHKRMYRRLRYSVFALTACSTVLASVALMYSVPTPGISIAIVLVTATVGVISSIEELRAPAKLWIHERTTHYALLDLKRELEFLAAGNPDDKAVEKCFGTMQTILGASCDKWSAIPQVQDSHGKGPASPEGE